MYTIAVHVANIAIHVLLPLDLFSPKQRGAIRGILTQLKMIVLGLVESFGLNDGFGGSWTFPLVPRNIQ